MPQSTPTTSPDLTSNKQSVLSPSMIGGLPLAASPSSLQKSSQRKKRGLLSSTKFSFLSMSSSRLEDSNSNVLDASLQTMALFDGSSGLTVGNTSNNNITTTREAPLNDVAITQQEYDQMHDLFEFMASPQPRKERRMFGRRGGLFRKSPPL